MGDRMPGRIWDRRAPIGCAPETTVAPEPRPDGQVRSIGQAAALLLLLAVGGCAANMPERLPAPTVAQAGGQTDAQTAARPDASARPTPSTIQALAYLKTIPVAPERREGYDRSDWPHWLDADGNCRNTRHEVLASESLEPPALSEDGCRVVGGLWRDAFTGRTEREPRRLDIDHFVPLAEAHRSGAHAWSREQRAAFANELSDPESLIAVTASANRSKSDQGPEEWLPPDASYRCRYVENWVAVKARWRLSMDARERAAVDGILSACGS